MAENINEIGNHRLSTNYEHDPLSLLTLDNIFLIAATSLFVLGATANIIVLRRAYLALRREHQPTPQRHVLIYISALLITDFMILFNIPFVVSDHYIGKWIFGEGFCKFVYCNECINKLLTSYIVAALSFDCLITIRKILRPSWRSIRTASITLMGCILLSLGLVFPLYLYIKTIDVSEENMLSINSSIAPGTYKCGFNPPELDIDIGMVFTLYIFICGFCLPALFIFCAYLTISYYLFKSGHLSLRSRARSHHVTWYILLLVVLYFFCWAPYWVITVVMLQMDAHNDNEMFNMTESSPRMTYIVLFMHLLPYVNAVLNPLAYSYFTIKQLHNADDVASRNFSRNETLVPENVPFGSFDRHLEMVILKNVEVHGIIHRV